MKLIIAGGREFQDYNSLKEALSKSVQEITEIVSGGAGGADKMGERYAKEMDLPCKIFPANWKKYGKSAGYRRNEEMANYADALLACWDGESEGTKHMIDSAVNKGLGVSLMDYSNK